MFVGKSGALLPEGYKDLILLVSSMAKKHLDERMTVSLVYRPSRGHRALLVIPSGEDYDLHPEQVEDSGWHGHPDAALDRLDVLTRNAIYRKTGRQP